MIFIRFFKAIMRSSAAKPYSTQYSAWATCLATLAVFVIHAPLAGAQAAPLERCSQHESIWLALTDGMVRISIDHPGVACAFRHKSQGFPSFNIVTTPHFEASEKQSQQAWEAGVLESYHKIGLVDATIETPGVAAIPNYAGPSAVIRYVNRGTAMSAFVAEIQADDRAYTLTALDRADHFIISRSELEALIRSVELRGQSTIPSRVASSRSIGIAIIVGLLLLILMAVGYRQRARSQPK